MAKSFNSVNALSRNIYEAFTELSEKDSSIACVDYDFHKSRLTGTADKKHDFVILIIYGGELPTFNGIRANTGCKKIVTLREVPYTFDRKYADFSFVCRTPPVDDPERHLAVGFPCNKKVLVPSKKEYALVLVDHYWESYLGTPNDRTNEIVGWLEEYEKRNFINVLRMIRYKDEPKTLKRFEHPLTYSLFPEYLEKTKDVCTYIITHKECFPWGALDMLARGTRVIAPEGFVPKPLVEHFSLGTFNDRAGFLKLIERLPMSSEETAVTRDLCVDFSDVAKIMNNKFKEWMR